MDTSMNTSMTPVTRTSFLFDAAHHHHHHQSGNIHDGEGKNLSPEQVMMLVEGLRSPVLASSAQEGHSLPKRQGLSRSNSLARGSFGHGRRESDTSMGGGQQQQQQQQQQELELEPVEYVEMNEDVLLPYVDRPSEVAELVEQPSNVSPEPIKESRVISGAKLM